MDVVTEKYLANRGSNWCDIAAEGEKLERELSAANATIQKLYVGIEEQNQRIKALVEALDHVVPICKHLHHPKKFRHEIGEDCPVVALVRSAMEGAK